MKEINFKKRETIEQIEESTDLAPKFDENGLIPVIQQIIHLVKY